ncbi:outer membrane protein Omp28 [Lacinutrix venerupis]|uniref:Omp28-related outer membrane protein n=1 Tax=Lacinutrix venerupis TaxID=1486034 RepID=UPI000EB4CFCD|nr:Omp28-related outer membrane protein [Lacinutrix venerupis]RLJ67344.1 outer membrane protein Omp28 [Lacinutrix venerupis]
MKSKFFFKELFVISFLIFAFSCSSDDSTDEGQVPANVAYITVSGKDSTAYVDAPLTFGVVNQLGEDVTASSEFKLDGVTITNPYAFNAVGSFVVTAINGGLTNTTTITVQPLPTDITLTVNNDAFWYDNGEAKFTAVDNLGNNITDMVTYSAESGSLSNPATFTVSGEYNAVATYTMPDNSALNSNSVTITAAESTHTTKVMIEDYTGAWCGYCPRLATALEDAITENANVIPVAIHNGDPMAFTYDAQLRSSFGVTGWPSARINRVNNWASESFIQVDPYLNVRQNMGLAINSSIAANVINAQVKVHYDLKIGYANRIVVYLLENGLVYNQVNYYNGDASSPWYQAGNPIVGFVHDHTARAVLTDVMGDAIPAAETETGNTYVVNYTTTVPSNVQNTNNLELVAFVVGPDNKVLNVQKAQLGENKDFD